MIIQRILKHTQLNLWLQFNYQFSNFSRQKGHSPSSSGQSEVVTKIYQARRFQDIVKIHQEYSEKLTFDQFLDLCNSLRKVPLTPRTCFPYIKKIANELNEKQMRKLRPVQLKKLFGVIKIIEAHNYSVTSILNKKIGVQIKQIMENQNEYFKQADLFSFYEYFARNEQTRHMASILQKIQEIHINNNQNTYKDRFFAAQILQFLRTLRRRSTVLPLQKKIFDIIMKYIQDNFSQISTVNNIRIYNALSGILFSSHEIPEPPFLKKIEQKISENINELSQKQIFIALQKSYHGQSNPLIEKIFNYTCSSINSEGTTQLDDFTIMNLLSHISFFQSMKLQSKDDKQKIMAFLKRVLPQQSQPQFYGHFIQLLKNNFFSLVQLQQLHQILKQIPLYKQGVEYNYFMNRKKIMSRNTEFIGAAAWKKSKKIAKYFVLIGKLVRSQPTNRIVANEYQKIVEYLKQIDSPIFLSKIFQGQQSLFLQEFNELYGSFFLDKFLSQYFDDNHNQIIEGKPIFQKRIIDQHLLNYIIFGNCQKQLRQIIQKKKSIINASNIRALLVTILEERNIFWKGSQRIIFFLLRQYQETILLSTFAFKKVLMFLNNPILMKYYGYDEIQDLFSTVIEYAKKWEEPYQKVMNFPTFLKSFLFCENRYVKSHPQNLEFFGKILELRIPSLLHVRKYVNRIGYFLSISNAMSQESAKVLVNLPQKYISMEIITYCHVVLQNLDLARQYLLKKEIQLSNLHLFLRITNKEYETLLEKKSASIIKVIQAIKEQDFHFIDQALCNFMLKSTKKNNQLFSILVQKYCAIVQKRKYIEPTRLLLNLMKVRRLKKRWDIFSLLTSIQKYFTVRKRMFSSHLNIHLSILEISQDYHNILPEYQSRLESYLDWIKHQKLSRKRISMIGRIYEILSSGYPIKSGQTLLFYINKKISKKSRWNILFFMPEGELKQALFTKILKFTHEKKQKIPEAFLEYFRRKIPSEKLSQIEPYKQKNFNTQEQYCDFFKKISKKYQLQFQIKHKFGLFLFKINDQFYGVVNDFINQQSKEQWKKLFECLFDMEYSNLQFISLQKNIDDILSFVSSNTPSIKDKEDEMKQMFYEMNKQKESSSSINEKDANQMQEKSEQEQNQV